MKVLVFNVKGKESENFIRELKKQGDEAICFTHEFKIEDVKNNPNTKGIIISGECSIQKDDMEILGSLGVQCVVTKSVGFDKIDIETAKQQGIDVSNIPSYSPNAISEFTVGLTLASIRNLKPLQHHAEKYQFGLEGMMAKEVRNMRIGIIGAGRIGYETIKNFSGFTDDIVAYDMYENDKVKQYATYVDLDTLFETSDVICLHAPSTKENYHLINKESISKMKDGVIIINTSRGELVDTEALVEAIRSKKVAKAALDVYEHEIGIYLKNSGAREDALLKEMIQDERIIVTPHIAFFTDEAMKNMLFIAVENIRTYKENGKAVHSLDY